MTTTSPPKAADSSVPPLNAALRTIADSAVVELAPVWQLPLRSVAPALFEVIPPLLDRWGLAASAAAADWYDHLRDTKTVSGRFTAIVEPLDDRAAYMVAGWAAKPLSLSEPDLALAQYRAEGGVQKQLVNAANKTVTHSVAEDPHTEGYVRQTRAGACKFCVMVASSGVYTKTSATFACHEHCHCQAVPIWGGEALSVAKYKPSKRPSTPEERARVRRWIKDNL